MLILIKFGAFVCKNENLIFIGKKLRNINFCKKSKREATAFKEWNEEQDHHNLQNDDPELIEISELDLFNLYSYAEVDELFLDSSMQYAKQKNDQTFEIDPTDLWDFVTIMTVSSYNVRPQFSMYWSFDEDVSCSFVRELMPRNRF